jgi:DNA-binding transcriptional LysR family regulator
VLIDLVQLRTFVTVAEEQHLGRAAERLHLSQSAASAHVRAIEERLGTQLFVRARSLELTRAGQLLLQRAKELLNEAAQFGSFARELRGRMEGTLVVGSTSEPHTRIGEIVAALRATHPLVTVDLRGRVSRSTRRGLESGELDVGILLGKPIDRRFVFHEMRKVRFVLTGPVAWRDKIERADWSEIAQLPWIGPSSDSSAYSGMVAERFGQQGIELNVVVLFENAAHGLSLLHAGVGMMLLPEEDALEGVRKGALAVSGLAPIDYSLCIAYQASRAEDPLIKAFLAAAREVWPGLSTTESATPTQTR